MKVAVHISQESLKRKQFESCGAYISRESLSSLNVAVYISRVVLRRKQFKS